ncbi:MAG: formate C-acetyltransferase [Mycoplasma sp.]
MNKKEFTQWAGFNPGSWSNEINVREFIQKNYTPYEGDDSFLAPATEATNHLWSVISETTKKEIANGGVLNMDTRVSDIDVFDSAYIDSKNKDMEKIVGLQTDELFKRAYMPIGGIRTAQSAAQAYGFKTDPEVDVIYEKYRKSHNQGVFDAYNEEMRMARKSHIITGLPDAYARGRIIGDYRRVALYGIDFLIANKLKDKANLPSVMTYEVIRLSEELSDQITALKKMKVMAQKYGFDIGQPASNAKEAIQWLYFGYLAAIREQNGAAMSIGRTSSFLDIYIERDLKNKVITEQQAQELIDHFVMKLRIVKFMRPPAYNQLFSGDPVWATESIGGMGMDGRTLVTKNSFRMIHTLANMGPAPEPNLTILWSTKLPENFKKFCAKYSILYSSMQYESDDLMIHTHGDDYAIACCVSPMKVGKQMQFFGARANLAKALLYAISGGYDELHPEIHLGPLTESVDKTKPLNYKEVYDRFKEILRWLAGLYVNTLNVIHYMHDKYYYEAAEMSLYDSEVFRFFATGIAGLSVVADSLSAIKHAEVTPKFEGNQLLTFDIKGDFPKYGNDDDRVDTIASDIVKFFMTEIKKHPTYRDSLPTMSVLTITSNVVYGKATGDTPDGRKSGEPFAPGANPMHGRDKNGAIASLASVAKIPFAYAADGVSNTFSIIPDALGKDGEFVIQHGDLELGDLGISFTTGCQSCADVPSKDKKNKK